LAITATSDGARAEPRSSKSPSRFLGWTSNHAPRKIYHAHRQEEKRKDIGR
jgi:hypothetical protein